MPAYLPVMPGRLASGDTSFTRTENPSKGGVCFTSDWMMKAGDRFRIIAPYEPGSRETEVAARIVWRLPMEGTSKGLYGVQLEEAV